MSGVLQTMFLYCEALQTSNELYLSHIQLRSSLCKLH